MKADAVTEAAVEAVLGQLVEGYTSSLRLLPPEEFLCQHVCGPPCRLLWGR